MKHNTNLLMALSIESLTTIKRWIAAHAEKLEENKKSIHTAIIRGNNKKLYEIKLTIEKYATPEKIDKEAED